MKRQSGADKVVLQARRAEPLRARCARSTAAPAGARQRQLAPHLRLLVQGGVSLRAGRRDTWQAGGGGLHMAHTHMACLALGRASVHGSMGAPAH